MTKKTKSTQALSPEVQQVLTQMGLRLRAYRQQQRWTLQDMAQRMLCSPVTYRALESGKPTVSVGALGHALWLLGQLESFNNVAPLPQDFARAVALGRRVRRAVGEQTPGTIGEQDRDF